MNSMKSIIFSFLALVLLSTTNSLYANDSNEVAEKSVTLTVEKMTCVTCPYIVKKSLTQTEGVQSAEVIFDEKKAIVVFDESKTSVEQLIAATTNVGFPSELVETETN